MNIIKSAKSGGKGSSIPPTIVVSIKAPPCPTPPPPHQWQSIVLPLIAGLLHARVFYRAALGCVPLALAVTGTTSTTTTATTSDEFRTSCYLLDSSIFLAYAFDLVSCLYFGVIPFSRCNCSRDIVGHHVPTLLLALPLAVPLWCDWERLRGIDMSSYSILDDPTVDGGTRDAFVSAYSMASGFAYVSSLNEVFMCLQRVEMSLAGVSSFRDVHTMGHRRFLTSRMGLSAELCYKLVFFWGMSLIACKACFDFDSAVYDYYHTSTTTTSETSASRWNAILAVCSSPAVLRGALFRAFAVVMYPSMGMRCLKKIGQLRREGSRGGEEDGNRKVVSS